MKKEIIGIIVCMLFVSSAFTVVVATNSEKTKLIIKENSSQHKGYTTLIAELDRVIEVDYDGNIVWEIAGLEFPSDVERLVSGNTLIVEADGYRVIEVNSNGDIVWEKNLEDFYAPCDAERLANGNTLIVIPYQQLILEVDFDGNIVWWTLLYNPWDVERLDNGNTLVADAYRVIEVDIGGNIVWGIELDNQDAERLDNGNTLLADGITDRVIEIDYDGNIVWEKTGLYCPTDVERLEYGNTLIVDTKPNEHRVIEVDSNGDIVWEITGLYYPWDAERLGDNQPPDNPCITGPTSGVVETEYNYTFVTIDPYGDNVSYYIEWGDDQVEEWIGPYASGEEVIVGHIWSEQGTYSIRAKAKDIYGVESDWSDIHNITIVNRPPIIPDIDGPPTGKPGIEYTFCITPIEPDGDSLHVLWDWGDGTSSGWLGPFESGEEICDSHIWNERGDYVITVTLRDDYGDTITAKKEISIPRNRTLVTAYWLRFLDMFPILQRILNYIL